MKVSQMFPSKYMSGDDLGGKTWSFKISQVTLEEMHDKKSNSKIRKPVVYFTGPRKGLILNKTIAEQIAAATGQDDTDFWPGRVVSLYSTTVNAFGANHNVIRVRPADNGPSETPPALEHDEDELEEMADDLNN